MIDWRRYTKRFPLGDRLRPIIGGNKANYGDNFLKLKKTNKIMRTETLSMKIIITFCGRVKMVDGEEYVLNAINARENQFCEIDARLSDSEM